MAPLHPISTVVPPFTQVIIDIVYPLSPLEASYRYQLILMDVATRYPVAITYLSGTPIPRLYLRPY